MKHPALTRVLSIVLVILCLTMAAAGGLGLRGAEKDRQSVLDDMGRLRVRIGDYRKVTESLNGRTSYDERSETLEEKQEQHDKESSEHRAELSTFTATQYGINMGTDAMDQADEEFAGYRYLFEKGMADFEPALKQITDLLGQLWTLYNAFTPILQNANAHLAAARGITAELDSGELTYGQLVAAYDELLRMIDETNEAVATLRELEPTLDAIAAFDPESLTSLTDGMSQIPSSLGSFGGVDLSVYQENGVDVNFDMNQLVQMKDGFDQYWGGIKQALTLLDTVAPQAEAQLQQLTGMSTAELRANAQAARDELAARGDEPLDPQQQEAILAVYGANSEQIHQGLDQAEAGLNEINDYAAQIESFLSTTQGQIDALNGLISQARQAMAEGAEALYQARAMIWWQMGQLREQEEELRQRKERLDQDADELQQLADAAEEQKTLEQRQSSLRAILLSRDEIRARYDAGEELGAAAQSFADEREASAEETYGQRRLACLLMLVGAGLGFIGIPAAFEALHSRFMLLAPVFLCLGCAAASEHVLFNMGRGHSYSALGVAGFAFLQLLVSIPRKKKKKRKKANQNVQGKHLKES